MGLTTEEQKELENLHQKFGGGAPSPNSFKMQAANAVGATANTINSAVNGKSLSPAEQAELDALKQKFSPDSGADQRKKQHDFDNTDPDTLERENQKALPGRFGQGLVMGAGVATAPVGLAASIPTVAAASLAKQKLQGQPMSVGETGKDVALNSLAPYAASKLAEWLSPLLGKTADKMQQVAMGMKKSVPGAGTEAIENGVRGTADTMKGQMSQALDKNGKLLDQAVGQLKGSVSSEPVANRVADFGVNKFQSPSGMTTEAGEDLINDAYNRGADINMRGEIAPEDARSLAQSAERAEGYSSQGAPKSNYQSQLARQEAQGYRDQLRQMGQDQGVPVAERMTAMHKLIKGNQALNAPETLSLNSPISSLGKAALKETLAHPAVMSHGAAGVNALSKIPASTIARTPTLFELLTGGKQEE